MAQSHEQSQPHPSPELSGFSDVFRRVATQLGERIPADAQAEWSALLDTLPGHRESYEQQTVSHAEQYVAEHETNIRTAEPGILLNKLFGEPGAWEEAKKPTNLLLQDKFRAEEDAQSPHFRILRDSLDERALYNRAASYTDNYVWDRLNQAASDTSAEIYLAIAPKRSLDEKGHLPESTARTIEVMAQHDFERKLEANLQGIESVLATPIKRVGRLALRKKLDDSKFTSPADMAAAVKEEIAKVQVWVEALQPDGNLYHEAEAAVRTEGFLPLRGREYTAVEASIVQKACLENSPERVMAEIRKINGLPEPPFAKPTAEPSPESITEPEPASDPVAEVEVSIDPIEELNTRIAAARAEGLTDSEIYRREVRSLPADPDLNNTLLRELNARFRSRDVTQPDESLAGRYRA